jgi:hypothetical protein
MLARFQCDACAHDHFVPLSCKTRGLCPSCGGRRMHQSLCTAVHRALTRALRRRLRRLARAWPS